MNGTANLGREGKGILRSTAWVASLTVAGVLAASTARAVVNPTPTPATPPRTVIDDDTSSRRTLEPGSVLVDQVLALRGGRTAEPPAVAVDAALPR